MPCLGPRVTIRDMTTVDRREILVLDEFRLRAADTDGAVAARVSATSGDTRDPVPLLTSIDDPCDVAALRTVSTGSTVGDGPRGDAALEQLVATWRPLRRYLPRLAVRAPGLPPSSYRLAVTESGINDERVASPSPRGDESTPGEPISLLVIGAPEGTHAGLLVLVGRDEPEALAGDRDHTSWPLPLSRDLGVRVYQSKPGAA
jgi:hypothetical protein